MDNFIFPFLVLMVVVFISRIINEKATKRLDQEKKAALIDLFSKRRIYTWGILLGIIVVYFFCLSIEIVDPFIALTIYLVSLIIFIIVNSYLSYRKLKNNDYPDFYIKSYILSTSLQFIGLLIFFLLMDF